MFYAPGEAFHAQFITTRFSTGAALDATGTPVATATRNGADDVAFALTVTKIDTGRYKIAGTVPAGYETHDRVQISVSATVDGVAKKGIVSEFQVLALTALADAILSRGLTDAVAQAADPDSLAYVIMATLQYSFAPGELRLYSPDGTLIATKSTARWPGKAIIRSVGTWAQATNHSVQYNQELVQCDRNVSSSSACLAFCQSCRAMRSTPHLRRVNPANVRVGNANVRSR